MRRRRRLGLEKVGWQRGERGSSKTWDAHICDRQCCLVKNGLMKSLKLGHEVLLYLKFASQGKFLNPVGNFVDIILRGLHVLRIINRMLLIDLYLFVRQYIPYNRMRSIEWVLRNDRGYGDVHFPQVRRILISFLCFIFRVRLYLGAIESYPFQSPSLGLGGRVGAVKR